jgi:uncharacterized protein
VNKYTNQQFITKQTMTSSFHTPRITSGFWGKRLEMNAYEAIFYQWEQLEQSRCIDNFRITAGQIDGFREGYFFADSDAYKWLDAASRILASTPDPKLKKLVDGLITLLESVQMPDGYIYTYNQIHFPGQRWVDLQIEHELYCLGHLIEAGVSHLAATGETRLLDLVRRAADLLARDFMDASPAFTDGHEEIELALIKLYRVTDEKSYLELSRRLLERRGRIPLFPLHIFKEKSNYDKRVKIVNEQRAAYIAKHPEHADFKLPGDNPSKKPPYAGIRQMLDQLSGKYFQQHTPVRKLTVPVGHSVRFGYLETAAAMLARETGDHELQKTLESAWERMVTRRMYVTGGLGALPFTEGFGRDYELDPEYAYAETCAALASMFWSDEMSRLTGHPRYDDLFEWQLYNAASVGIGMDGRSYFYNNPLACRGGLARAGWYLVPCCPPNLSRTWASLGGYLYRETKGELTLQQYVTSAIHLDWGTLNVDSGLPWTGEIRLTFDLPQPHQTTLHLRIPSWADTFTLTLNGSPLKPDSVTEAAPASETACGYSPLAARTLSINRTWSPGDKLDLTLDMPLRFHRQHKRVPGCGGMDALSRGPLVYCLESVDNPLDLFPVTVKRDSLKPVYDDALLGGIWKIAGSTPDGTPLTFIPYMLWGNRGASQMNVFFRTSDYY